MNTLFEYFYRDDGNWKQHAPVVFEGELTTEQIKSMMDHCHEREFFVPGTVNLDSMNFNEYDLNEYHEIDNIVMASVDSTDERTAQQFYDEWMAVEDWDHVTHSEAAKQSAFAHAENIFSELMSEIQQVGDDSKRKEILDAVLESLKVGSVLVENYQNK